MAIGYQKIHNFPDLVDSCRIYEEDNNAHYKILSEKRDGKGKQKVAEGQRTSGGDPPACVVCFKYGKPGHKSNACTAEVKRCFLYGKAGHTIVDCKHKEVICFNCGEEGHISSQFQKPKKAQAGGKMFALAGTPTAAEDRLIRDTSKGSVITSLVCLKCPLSIFDRDFAVDLVCLLLHGLDVILGMNWLEYNYVHINCYNKSVRFSTPDEEEETGLLSARQLRKLMQEETQVFSLTTSLSIENQATIDELKVVREFPKVFPDEIPDVPPEREVEFAIDLVPGIRPVSMHHTGCQQMI
ncbi:uncharacterized protein LOC131637155 [Vicia villosa]|uniref:uncharacterized protein LOC131637155 n=1 Tax=Vicia villosa TaxID=3911 RepID=UPI00273A9B76|nr:uncharacterized protein LOC131637155 [Vicia villosa]